MDNEFAEAGNLDVFARVEGVLYDVQKGINDLSRFLFAEFLLAKSMFSR